MLVTNLALALKALRQNRLQALLTLSGMSIGVAMVVIVSGLGKGAQQQIEFQIESAGPTLITIRSGNFQPVGIVTAGEQDSSGGEVSGGGLTDSELAYALGSESAVVVPDPFATAVVKKTRSRSPAWPLGLAESSLLRNEIPDIRAVAGSVSGNISIHMATNSRIRTARVFGFEPDWQQMQGWQLSEGRWISNAEHQKGSPLILVNNAVAERLWPDQSALEQTLVIGDKTMTVTGIIEDGEKVTGTIIVPTVYMPFTLASTLLDRAEYDELNVRTTSVAKTTGVASNIKAALRVLREIPDDTLDDFRVETQSVAAMPSLGTDPRLARAVHSNVVEFEQAAWEEMALSLRQAGRTFTILLSAAAAVSLLVGGIGVMNIMLVSVTARTREIGLRMALGARMNDVLVQFMVEAVTLAALGGVIGLLLGSIGLVFAKNGLDWATAISPSMLFIAIAMAAITGIIFGYGPARRAASLDPVVALKAE